MKNDLKIDCEAQLQCLQYSGEWPYVCYIFCNIEIMHAIITHQILREQKHLRALPVSKKFFKTILIAPTAPALLSDGFDKLHAKGLSACM